MLDIRSAIYSLLIRKVTWAHYDHLLDVVPTGARILDVGVGNGLMLDRFAGKIRDKKIRIHGLDIHAPYLEECRRRIERFGITDLVRVENEGIIDYLERTEELPQFVYFSTSFMLIDRERVLALLSRRMRPAGRAMFAQTLLPESNAFADWLKPKMKYLTSVDFGQAQYKDGFESLMKRAGFALNDQHRFGRLLGNRHMYFHTYRSCFAEADARARLLSEATEPAR